MRDSNNTHATMLDAWPPIMYLNDTSRKIIDGIHELNGSFGNTPVAGYTFEAGPNAHIVTLQEHKKLVYDMLLSISGIKRIIEAGPGQGPRAGSPEEALIDPTSLSIIKRIK